MVDRAFPAVLDKFVNDFRFPVPADSLLKLSLLPHAASVGALGEFLDNLSACHLSLPCAFDVLVMSINIEGALLALSKELLFLFGTLEVKFWPQELVFEGSLVVLVASDPLSKSILGDDTLLVVDFVSLDDFLSSWPANESLLVFFLPECALLFELVESFHHFCSLHEALPLTFRILIFSSGVSHAVLTLSHELSLNSGTLEIEVGVWSEFPWFGAAHPFSSCRQNLFAVASISFEFL